MLSHANFSMSARAALAAAAAAGMSYASGSVADLATGFDVWSRGSDSELTQKEWIDFYSAVHRTGARAYWTIGKRAGEGAVAEECCGESKFFHLFFDFFFPRGFDGENSHFFCRERTHEKNEKTGVLVPGLVEIAKTVPPRMGMPAIALPLARAEADGVRFDSDGDGIGEEGFHDHRNDNGTAEAALTHVDIMEWGILRLGTLCDALPPMKAMGH